MGPAAPDAETDQEIAVLETDVRGHHLAYVRHLAAALPAKAWTWVTGTDADRSAEFEVHLRETPPGRVVAADGSRRAAVRTAIREARRTRRRRLVIPDGDLFLGALLTTPACWFDRSVRISVLVMRTPVTFHGPVHRLRMLGKQLLATAVSLLPPVDAFFLTDAFGVVERRRGYGTLTAVPDPVERTDDSPVDLDAADGPFTVAAVGFITARKNAALLVEAAAHEGDTTVLLAGLLDDDVRAEASGPTWQALREAGRLTVLDRRLSREEFDRVLATSHAVAVLHDNDAPSGILAEGALRGTPAVVAAGGWLEEVVRARGLGVATALDVPAVAAALREVRGRRTELRAGARAGAEVVGTDAFVRALLG